jgi:hypothetical protein
MLPMPVFAALVLAGAPSKGERQRYDSRPLVVAGEQGSIPTLSPSPWSGTEFPGIDHFVCPEPVRLVQRWGDQHGISVGVLGDEFTAILDAAPGGVAMTMDVSLHWRDDDPRLTYLIVFYENETLGNADERRLRRKYRLRRLIRQVRKAAQRCAHALEATAYRATMPRTLRSVTP